MSGFLNKIPGYRGYRAKEDRRDADRRVRDHLVIVYGSAADRIEAVAKALADQRRLGDVGPVDQFAQQLLHFIDRVRTATYGYGGLFSDRDVNELALDQLRQFDESLASGIDELAKPIDALEAALASGGDVVPPAQAGSMVVRQLLARLDLRDQVIETGKPADQASVLKVLEKPGAEAPPAAYDMKKGDALSVLGDDYVVDATIDVDAGAQSFRLFRVRAEPEQWLFVPRQPADTPALLSAVAAETTPSGQTTIDGVAYTATASGAGNGQVSGVGGNSDQRSVRFTRLRAGDGAERVALLLDWGKERQVLAGKDVHSDDIEVYRRRG